MIEILPQSTDACVGIKFSGDITAEDYDILLPKLDEAIAASGKINFLVVMGDFKWRGGLEGAKADYKMGTQQYRRGIPTCPHGDSSPPLRYGSE